MEKEVKKENNSKNQGKERAGKKAILHLPHSHSQSGLRNLSQNSLIWRG